MWVCVYVCLYMLNLSIFYKNNITLLYMKLYIVNINALYEKYTKVSHSLLIAKLPPLLQKKIPNLYYIFLFDESLK